MGYFNPEFLPNEKSVYSDHQHWIIYLPTLGWLLLGGLLYWHVTELRLLSDIVFGITIISFLYAFISYMTSLFMVTNMRVIMRTGFFSRSSLDILLEKIEGIEVNQSLLGGLLRYGTVKVIGTGGTEDVFFKINNPLKFRRVVQHQIQFSKKE